MPPVPSWYAGREAIATFVGTAVFPRYRLRMVRLAANHQPAFGLLAAAGHDDRAEPLALQVLGLRDGLVAEISGFVDPRVLARFGLHGAPLHAVR